MNFLARVASEKHGEIALRREQVPVETLAERIQTSGVRDFRAAISRPRAIIAELKARTPTIASFTHSADLMALATTYADNGAAAISIVTDRARFGTGLEDVARVRESVPLPVIAKDFVVDPYQILEARAAGADAVLLIVRLLDLDQLRSLSGLVHDLGMHALVETHSEEEVLAALTVDARIIGINNRDLDTMQISLDVTRRLAPLVPGDVVVVAESGIRDGGDVESLAASGARAFLVGGSLLDAGDPGALLRELAGRKTEQPERQR